MVLIWFYMIVHGSTMVLYDFIGMNNWIILGYWWIYPLIMTNIAIDNEHWNSGLSHETWLFSIVTRGYLFSWKFFGDPSHHAGGELWSRLICRYTDTPWYIMIFQSYIKHRETSIDVHTYVYTFKKAQADVWKHILDI